MDTSFEGNVNPIIIPTALGIIAQSTHAMGGGQLNITVNGYVKKTTRIELEQYLVNLYTTMSTEAGTITVTYGGSSYTLTNCYFRSGSAGSSGKVYSSFSLEFIKSAY